MNKSQLIKAISQAGDRYGSLLLNFMDCNGLKNLKDATVEQLATFAEERHIIVAQEV